MSRITGSRRRPSIPGMSLPLLAYRSGLTTRETFVRDLMASLAVVLVDAVDEGGGGLACARPLILRQPGRAPALAVFSGSYRATGWIDAYPPYRHPLEVTLSWMLLGLPGDHGIVVDPGDDDEIELEPAELAASLPAPDESLTVGIANHPGYSYRPYWMIDTQRFNCYPVMAR